MLVKLTVVSPQQASEYKVQWIEGQTPEGSIIIQPDHAPIIMSLVAGSDFSFVLEKTDEKKTIHLERNAFLEVTRTSAVMLIGQDKTI
jgi:F0F1-type ATP synthase epsilon subunit